MFQEFKVWTVKDYACINNPTVWIIFTILPFEIDLGAICWQCSFPYDSKRFTFSGVKPFKCSQCDKSFTQRCSLEAHSTRVHGVTHKFSFRERRPKIYVCEDCGETFQDNGKFRQHAKEHGTCVIAPQLIGLEWSSSHVRFENTYTVNGSSFN